MNQQNQVPVPETEIKNIISAALFNLSEDQLRQLIENEQYFESFLMNLPKVQTWNAKKALLVENNKLIAQYNLTFEPKLNEGKSRLLSLYEQARNLADELELKRSRLDSLSSKSSIEATQNLLKEAADKSEEDSEELANKLLDGEIELDAFLTPFFEQRANMHLRKLKSEKLNEMASAQRNRPGSRSGPGLIPPYPQINSTNFGGPQSNFATPPYPVSGQRFPYPQM